MSGVEACGPGRVALTALGCKVNWAEMASLAGTLAAAGCEIVAESEPADVRVLNSCTVTLQADATTRQRLRRLRAHDPGAHIVLTGCSVDGNPSTYLRRDAAGEAVLPAGVDAVFANARKAEIAEHVLQLLPAARARRGASAPPRRTRAFIKVQDGCDHSCTYCSVWRARGASTPVAPEMVLDEVLRAEAAGAREAVLTGVDLGSYRHERCRTLAALLTRLLEDTPATLRLRLSSVNTNDITAPLLELAGHPRLCSHWHMPLQSGSDAVLRAMHRGYRRRQYLRVCEELRDRDPDMEFTTDIMVGFPGESEDDHEATLGVVAEAQLLSAHVFRYSSRPGTPAATMPSPTADGVARRRSAEVRRAAQRSGAARRARAVGRDHDVIWESVAAGVARGLTSTYLEVRCDDGGLRRGGADPVTVTAVEGELLRARLRRP
ncbi:MAG: MiaB/RimO family radical SAM methylthiotransferase [Candidatus Dormibacteria bacterium]